MRRACNEAYFVEKGQKEVEMWGKGEYDLILMDIKMPLKNGFKSTVVIRETGS